MAEEARSMKARNVEDVYELTPIQHGLLFHCLEEPTSGVYVEQVWFTLQGDLDRDAFWRAWQTVLDRHPALRSSYHWDGTSRPVQTVHRRVSLPYDEQDWRDLDAAAQEERLETWLAEERRRGFDMETPPLMRFTLLRLADDRWRLCWRLSHLVMDGWSFGLVMSEFTALYKAYFHASEPALPEPRPYRDYVAWWKRQDPAVVEDWWRRTLDGFTPSAPLDLCRRPDPPADGITHEREELSLGDVADDLRTFARENGLTLHTLVQGAWTLLLSRCLDDDDVLVATTTSHRPASLPGGETIVGPLVVTVPVRAPVDPEAATVDWLRSVQDALVGARDHAAAPLTDIAAWAPPEARQAPLFESIISFENVPIPEVSFADEGLELLDHYPDGRPQYPMSVVVHPGDDLPLRVIYDRRRFDAATARTMLDRLHATLVGLTRDPSRRLGDVDVCTPEERRALTARTRPTTTYDVTETIHGRVAAHAAARPDEVAVTAPGRTLTWAELDAEGRAVARRLRTLGVRRGSRVGLCAHRGADALVGMVGILRAGAAYVPVDPAHPADRRALVLRDADVTALVAHADLVDGLGADVPDAVVRLDTDDLAAGTGTDAADDTDPDVCADDPAYVIYTSGSTGTPKGAVLAHANVVRLVEATDASLPYEPGPADVWSTTHSFAFDGSVWEVWGALLRGSRLLVVDTDVARDAERLHGLLGAEGVTVCTQSPSSFARLVDADGRASAAARDALALRCVVLGGERVEPATLAPWFDRHDDTRPYVVNAYGPTEATVLVSHHTLTRDETARAGAPSLVGHPLPDSAIHLRDGHGRLVPPGVPGQMYLAGDAVALGYHARPELTASRFVLDPYATEDDEDGAATGDRPALAYASGDLARLDPSGELEFLGRNDAQVSLRGYRVEPGEVEAVLREVSGVRHAAVVLREDTPGDPRLVAYVVGEEEGTSDAAGSGGAPDEAVLEETCARALPAYMVPAAFVGVDSLPLTVNGKLDVRALPAPGVRSRGVDATFVEPRTDTEQHLAAMLAEVLGLDRVGAEDNLVDLGLHSLLATGVVTRIREAWRVPLPLRTLFESPTVAALAQVVESGGVAAADRPAGVDLAAEAVLDPAIRPEGPAEWTPEPAQVLLTGATGLLGGALLERLLRTTPATVHCLVRADDAEAGAARIRAHLDTLGLWDDAFADRLVAVPGSLTKPYLGLPRREFTRLAGELDEVYHCGAQVNFLQPYRRMRAANVLGTREVLRLAATGRTSTLHHVSTLSVFPPETSGDGTARVLREDPLAAEPPALGSGYAETKWVSERLVAQAAERGLPVSIYRPGRVVGDSRTGLWTTGDATSEIMRACVRLGAAPDLEATVDMVPVDYCAEALTTLARTKDAVGGTYHLVNPHPVTVSEIADGMERAGYGVARLGMRDWYAGLVRASRTDESADWSVAVALLGRSVQEYRDGAREPVFDATRAHAALGDAVTCARVDADLVAAYLARLAEDGHVAPPGQAVPDGAAPTSGAVPAGAAVTSGDEAATPGTPAGR